MNQEPDIPPDFWGLPAHLRSARGVFYNVVRPVLDTENPPMVDFHSRLSNKDPIPAPLVSQYLDHLRALGHNRPTFAWAAANAALDQAILHGHIGVVQGVLSVPGWRLCARANVFSSAICNVNYAPLLLLLASDCRVDDDQIWRLFGPLLYQASDEKYQDALRFALTIPRIPPMYLWRRALDLAMSVMLGSQVSILGECEMTAVFRMDDVMDLGEWQFARARNQRMADRELHQRNLWPVPPRLLQAPGSPELLAKLPLDVQFMLHDLLDLSTAHSLRLTCRALQHFPMDRFAQLRVEHELRRLSLKSTEFAIKYDPVRIRQLIDGVPGCAGPSTMDYRVLVEAVRCLDVDLALQFLCPQEQDQAQGYDILRARNPESTGYVVSWALHVLFKTLSSKSDHVELAALAKGGLILQALLLHPLLYQSAWSLVLHYVDLCRTLLIAATVFCTSKGAACLQHHQRDSIATAKFFVDLIRTGTIVDPIPPVILADLEYHDDVPNLDYHTRSQHTIPHLSGHIFIMLATLSFNSVTFTKLVNVLPSLFHLNKHLNLLAMMARRADSTRYVTHVLTALAGVSQVELYDVASHLLVGGGGGDHDHVLDQLAARFTDPNSLWSLLVTRPELCNCEARNNAVLLVHWLRLVAPSALATGASDPGVVAATAANRGVNWAVASDLICECLWVLQRAERHGYQAASKWHRELSAAWDPVRARIGLESGWWDKAKSHSCIVQ